MASAYHRREFGSLATGWIESVAAAMRGWRERRHLAAELGALDEFGDLGAVLADTGLSRSQVATLLRAPTDAGRRLGAMADRAGTDLAALPPTIRRDAEWTCTTCTESKACRRWLRSDPATGVAGFCPNAPVFRRQARRAAAAEAARGDVPARKRPPRTHSPAPSPDRPAATR